MEKPIFLSRKNLFSKFVGVDVLAFSIKGGQKQMQRFVATRPDAAAIVLYNPEKDSVVLIKQFRAPVFSQDHEGVIYEVPAGVIEQGESAESTIVRETQEETGYHISNPELLSIFYPSCGLLNERIFLFYASISEADKVSDGGGLDEENESIDVIELPVKDAFKLLKSGQIADAKAQLALFYLKEKICN